MVATAEPAPAPSSPPTPPTPVPDVSPAEYGWDGPVRLPDLWDQLAPGILVTFAKVIDARQATADLEYRAEARAAEVALRRKFVDQNGQLLNAFYCGNIIAGCALTERTEKRGRRHVTTHTLYTTLNRATPELAALEHRCNVLAVRANSALGGRASTVSDLRVATDMAFSAMTRVLRAADEAAAPDATKDSQLIKAAAQEVAEAERVVGKTIEREGGFTYFQGVLAGAVLAFVLSTLLGIATAQYWPKLISTAGLVGALVFGALGAVTSVFQRISADGVTLTFTPSRMRLMALGSLRPLVGSTFGVVAYLGIVAGVLGSATVTASASSAFGLAAITGFAAGFSERLATDVVKRAEAIGTVSTTREPEAGGS
ncbi:MAG: hypothetical protein E6F99_00380 [Actinobacteria bacterium]|nr:MAG: hypothetical protein E6F99_00380 [Actinomycetota bacterium]